MVRRARVLDLTPSKSEAKQSLMLLLNGLINDQKRSDGFKTGSEDNFVGLFNRKGSTRNSLVQTTF